MNSTISANIIASTSLCENEVIALRGRVGILLNMLSTRYSGFWGRVVKKDSIECYIPNPKDAFRIALILKTNVKSFAASSEIMSENKRKELFMTYGVRICIGLGDMQRPTKAMQQLEGDAISLSEDRLNAMPSSRISSNAIKQTMVLESRVRQYYKPAQTMLSLLEALINRTTTQESLIIYQKLLGLENSRIATTLDVSLQKVNDCLSLVGWDAIEEALKFVEEEYQWER